MRIGRGIALTLLASAAGAAQTSDSPMQSEARGRPVYATGVVPASPEDYAKMPKVGRYRADLPATVDLTGAYPSPGYQGQSYNCTAWASTYAARSFLYGKDIGRRLAVGETLSPAYVYNRLRPAGSNCTIAVPVSKALDLLKTEGSVSFADFPDDPARCGIPAPEALRAKASAFRISAWRAIGRENNSADWHVPLVLDDIKGALSRGTPVVFSMAIDDAFRAYKTGTYTVAARTGDEFHSMALVGYDESRQAFRAINSWGTGWGDHGYLWIDYQTFRRLVSEAYALEAPLARANTPPPTPQQQFDTAVAGFRCGAVQVRRDHGRAVIFGYGGVQESIDQLRTAANAAYPGAVWQVASHPWPQCEAEATLGPALGADGVAVQVVDESGAAIAGDPVPMHAGDKFGFVARASAARPYLSIVYLQADGSAVQLYRGEPAPGAGGRREVTLGTGGERQVRFQVGPPFGNEVLIALASAKPLFGAELESYATERQFLTGLRAHMLAARGNVSAAVLRLKTIG